MADPDPNDIAATLVRRRQYTIQVPGFFPVTYSRGEGVPQKHFVHVPGRDRRWFDSTDQDDTYTLSDDGERGHDGEAGGAPGGDAPASPEDDSPQSDAASSDDAAADDDG